MKNLASKGGHFSLPKGGPFILPLTPQPSLRDRSVREAARGSKQENQFITHLINSSCSAGRQTKR